MPTTPTLDDDRTAQLRTFLTVEAARSLADGSADHPAPFLARHRRVAAGAAAATLLGGGIFAVTAITGGPGPAHVDQAVAISVDDGWTTIDLLDVHADPDAVLAQLR